MRTSAYVKPKYEMIAAQTVLDMRVVPFERSNGKELNDLIHASVADYVKWFEQELPSILRVTQKQFASLNSFSEEMYHTTDRMFAALDGEGRVICVMEIHIGDEIDQIEELDDIINESEAMLAEKDFSKMEIKKQEIDPTKPNVLTPGNFKDQF